MRHGSHIKLIALFIGVSSGIFAQGDLCSNATTINCGAVVSGNSGLYTADTAPFCGTGDGTGGGVWYMFTGTGSSVTASLCGSAYDTKIRVYSGSCAAPTCVAGNDDFCGLQSQVNWLSNTGTVYYILVHGFGGGSGIYTLTLTCPPPPVPLCYSTTVTPYLADPFTGTQVTLTDDQHSGVVPIGFSFCFNGSTYTQCVISSNNYITFDVAMANSYSPWVTVAVPNITPTQVRNTILNPWQDINPAVGGNIYYQTVGVAPNRRFVVSYLNVPMFSCTSQLYTSQTILFEGSNCIGSHIATKPICTSWNSGNAVHGLHNSGGSSATVVAGRNNTQWTATALGTLFVPTCAPCSTLTSNDCLATVLPLELLFFRGRNAQSDVILEWATATELNTLRFIVQRSSNGLEFEAIAFADAAGNSQQTIEYQLKDEAPLDGANYYRLQSVDIDGSATLSDVIEIDHLAFGKPVIYPNPASDLVNIKLPSDLQIPTSLLIQDVFGRIVRTIELVDPSETIQITGLASGAYFLELPALGAGFTTTFMVE